MSVSALAWAFEQPCKPTAKLVLLALADHADDTGRCWPSLTRLMRRTGLSRDALCRQLGVLETAGFVARQRGHAEDRTSTVYTVCCTGKQSGSRTSPGAVLVRETDRSSPGAVPKQYGSRTRTVMNHHEPRQVEQRAPRATRATAWPSDFVLTDDLRAVARSLGANPEVEWPLFRDYHEAKGSRFASWPAAWRNWCRRAVTFAANRRPARSTATDDPRFAALLAANPELAP